MRKLLLPLFLALIAQWANAFAEIEINHTTVNSSIGARTELLEDKDGSLTIGDLLKREHQFKPSGKENKNLGFTNSTYWGHFVLSNKNAPFEDLLIEVSRAVTNNVTLYRVKNGVILDTMKAGDHTPFGQRSVEHRKNLFPVHIQKGEKEEFFIKMHGGGEALMYPVTLWERKTFTMEESKRGLTSGVYYGVLLFVFLIFGFFYWVLQDQSFLYYVLYILGFAILQFSLDGYAYRFFFSDSPWLADRAVVSVSNLVVFLVTIYSRCYLKVIDRSPILNKLYMAFLFGSAFGFLVSLTSGPLHNFSYPFINILSFVNIFFIVYSILHLKVKGYQVSNFFFIAYLLLVTGVIIFLLGNTGIIPTNLFTQNGLKYGSLGEVIFLSFTMGQKYRELQEQKEKAQEEAVEKLKELNQVKDQHNKELEIKVAERTSQLEKEREKLDEINKEMLSSIRYAKRIQNAILPPHQVIDQLLDDWSVLFKPRDIVSGDLYWIASVNKTPNESQTNDNPVFIPTKTEKDQDLPSGNNLIVFSVFDCTGHGVPGAFLTFVGHNILNHSLQQPQINSPAEALDYLDQQLKRTLEHRENGQAVKDGMDMGLCALDKENMKLEFAGANNPCYIIRNGEIIVLQPDKMAIGGAMDEEKPEFTNQTFDLEKGDAIYLFSDGYPDQFGGPKGKKFKYKPFKRLLCSIQDHSMDKQREILENSLEEWQGKLEQVDDICVMGMKV